MTAPVKSLGAVMLVRERHKPSPNKEAYKPKQAYSPHLEHREQGKPGHDALFTSLCDSPVD